MICHVDINKLLPRSNNDTKQSVTCNKIYLFASKEGKTNSPYVFEVWDTNHSYMKLRHETQKLQKTKFHSISFNKNVKWSTSKIVVVMKY